MNGKYTPGPWIVGNEFGKDVSVLRNAGPSGSSPSWLRVANVPINGPIVGKLTARSREAGIANARLIAAAPELLEALKSIVECGRKSFTNKKYDVYFESARAAITKAEEDL